jgi:ABC-2 type transport system ATP-binding protein
VLILDEPTSGLDPNQLVEIRSLIKEIGREKTVILSTHIMQEVEAICDRVIIINKGKIVANDETSNLKALTAGNKIYVFEFDKEISKDQLLTLQGIIGVELIATNNYKVTASEDIRGRIFEFAKDNSLALLSSKQEENSLEDIFRSLTK